MVLFLLVNIFPAAVIALQIPDPVQLVTAVYLENRFRETAACATKLNASSVLNVEDILIGIG